MQRVNAVATWSAALVLGTGLFFVGHLVQPAVDGCVGLAVIYQEQSQDPLALRGAAPHRLFAPLLAWLLGLGGSRYWMFAHGSVVLLLATVAVFCRQRGSSWPATIAVTMAIALSGPAQVYKTFNGFPEPFGFVFLLFAAMASRRGAACWGLWLLALSVHEVAALFLPWLWWERRRIGVEWRRDLVPVLLACGVYAGLRAWISAAARDAMYSFGLYASYNPFPWGAPGLCVLTIADSLVTLGPLLFLLGWYGATANRGERNALLAFLVGLTGVQCVAIDFHRFVNLLVVPLVTAAQQFAVGPRRIAAVALAALGAAASFELGSRRVVPVVGEQMLRCNALAAPQAFGTCVVPALAGLMTLLCTGVGLVLAVGIAIGRHERSAMHHAPAPPPGQH